MFFSGHSTNNVLTKWGQTLSLTCTIGMFSNFSHADVTSYELIDLGVFEEGSSLSIAYGINDVGQIVGLGDGAITAEDDESTEDVNEQTRDFYAHAGIHDGMGWMDLGAFEFNPEGFEQTAIDLVETDFILSSSIGFDINILGDVVGYATEYRPDINVAEFVTTVERPVRYDGTQWVVLDPAIEVAGRATAINDDQMIVGYSRTETATDSELFRNLAWYHDGTDEGVFNFIPLPSDDVNRFSTVVDINNSNRVVGTTNGIDLGGDVFDRAFYFDVASSTEAIGINTLGGSENSAAAVNNNGVIVGSSYLDGDPIGSVGGFPYFIEYAFLFDPASGQGPINLGTLSEEVFRFSKALDINDVNQVVGYSNIGRRLGFNISHAFIYENEQMTDLNVMIDCKLGWELSEARSINNLGQIVGTGIFNDEQRAFLLNPVEDGTPADQSCDANEEGNILDENNEGGSLYSTFFWLLFALLGVKVAQTRIVTRH
ncbi:MAG: DUF3466 family protein [Pseudomonadota bacterium]